MHRRRAIVATDDAHTSAWLDSAVSTLDLTVERVSTGALDGLFASDGVDVFVADAGRSAEAIVVLAERAVSAGRDVRLLLVIDSEALAHVRLPVRFAADFVVRTASPGEVAARVRALVWPGEEVAAEDVIRMEELTLNLATYQAHVRGVPIEFTYLEYALFAFLVQHPNRVYSREVLLHRVWGTDYYGGARTVDVHVRRVRAKLGPEFAARLETVRNVGYLWRR